MSKYIEIDIEKMTAKVDGHDFILEEFEYRVSSSARYFSPTDPPSRGYRTRDYRVALSFGDRGDSPLVALLASQSLWELGVDGGKWLTVYPTSVSSTLDRHSTIVEIYMTVREGS